MFRQQQFSVPGFFTHCHVADCPCRLLYLQCQFVRIQLNRISQVLVHPEFFGSVHGYARMDGTVRLAVFGKCHPNNGAADGTEPEYAVSALKV